jgi:hypothetical protein
LKNISSLFKIKKNSLVNLKNLFLEHYSRMTYISNATHIHDLVNIYYLILLKTKFIKFTLQQVAKYSFEETKVEFKARKLEII